MEGFIAPKSRRGVRRVPMNGLVRSHLAGRLREGSGAGFVFGRSETVPFSPLAVSKRAKKAWAAAGLDPIGLHECRHTYATFMIAAGVNAKALSTYMGHATVSITLDRYGHLLPGNEHEAVVLLDRWLAEQSQRGARG